MQLCKIMLSFNLAIIVARARAKSFGSVLEDFISFLAPATVRTVGGSQFLYKFAADANARVHVVALGKLLLLKSPIVAFSRKLD